MMHAKRLPPWRRFIRMLVTASLAQWLPEQTKRNLEVASPQPGDRDAPRGAAWLPPRPTHRPRLRARARVHCGTPPHLRVVRPPQVPPAWRPATQRPAGTAPSSGPNRPAACCGDRPPRVLASGWSA